MTETQINLSNSLRLTITRWDHTFTPTVEVEFLEQSGSYLTSSEWRSVDLDAEQVAELVTHLSAVLPEMSSNSP
jgi:hypothetical protein